MPGIQRATSLQEKPLLAEIDLFRPPFDISRLIFPTQEPRSRLESIRLFLLKPLMTMAAKFHVMRFLEQKELTNRPEAAKLLANIRGNFFRGVSEAEWVAVLAEEAMNGNTYGQQCETLTTEYFKDPDNMEKVCLTMLDVSMENERAGLNALLSFIRQPESIKRGDDRIVKAFANAIQEKAPGALRNVIADYEEDFYAAHEEAVSKNSFMPIEPVEARRVASVELRNAFPASAGNYILAFENFSSFTPLNPSMRAQLNKFLPLFRDRFPQLTDEAKKILLPKVIAIEDKLGSMEILNAIDLDSSGLTETSETLASTLKIRIANPISGAASFSPSAAISLMEYMMKKEQISRALQKNSAEENEEVKTLRQRLINPESFPRLEYILQNTEALSSLLYVIDEEDEAVRETANAVLSELQSDLKAYRASAKKTVQVNQPAPASQSPDPAASFHSVQS